MSAFADLVRARVVHTRTTMGLPRASLEGVQSSEVVQAANRAFEHLAATNGFCRNDDRCRQVSETLGVVRTEADIRTALTQAQALLASLTAEDADVAGDTEVQTFRRQLHLLLDH